MPRLIRTALLAGFIAVGFPATAVAQFNPVIGPYNPLYRPTPWNPYSQLYQPPAYQLMRMRSPYDFQFSLGISLRPNLSPLMGVPRINPVGPSFPGYPLMGGGNPSSGGRYFDGGFFVGMTSPATGAPQGFYPYWGLSQSGTSWGSSGPTSSGYISGGIVQRDVFAASQREFERAQREATVAAIRKTPQAVKDAIYEQWAYEKLGVFGLPALKGDENQPELLVRALNVTEEQEVASGELLNHILVAIVAATNKGAKGPSAFLPPHLLAEVRFAEGPTADAVNLLRLAGKLPFPPAFDDPKLKDVREALERDFAAAAVPLREGKSADPAKFVKLEQTLRKAQEAATPVIRDLPFEAATASRRFLNRFEKAVPVMKSAAGPALVNAAWGMEGTSVADLVKHMTKHKLLFAPVNEGGEGAYFALHRGLATYLFALNQPKK